MPADPQALAAPQRPTDAEISQRIEDWHSNRFLGDLAPALGWTQDEYAAWAQDPSQVPDRPLPTAEVLHARDAQRAALLAPLGNAINGALARVAARSARPAGTITPDDDADDGALEAREAARARMAADISPEEVAAAADAEREDAAVPADPQAVAAPDTPQPDPDLALLVALLVEVTATDLVGVTRATTLDADLGLDELDRIELINAVEVRFDADIPLGAEEGWNTVGDILDAIAAAKATAR